MKKQFWCLIAALMLVGTAVPVQATSSVVPHLFGGSFELRDEDGAPITDQDFKGRYMLITFGYTFCPDICPTMLSTFSQAMDDLGAKADRVVPIFVTLDPKRDTPDVMKSYVRHFHPTLRGLSGSDQQIARIAKRYRVHRSLVAQPDKGAENYLVNHSSLAFLMSPSGAFLTLFPHGTGVEKMTQAMRGYLD